MSISNLPKGARDRFREDINPVFAERILKPIFDFNNRHHFFPLLTAHRAWLIGLTESGSVEAATACKILDAIDRLESDGPEGVCPFDPTIDYYYLHVERALVQRLDEGEAVAGNLNLGRTRPEPLARMVLRSALLDIIQMVLDLRRTLINRAAAEAQTVMPGYTHLQHAQPMTLGHYLLAIHDHLLRDTKRLLAALATTDQCTLGCGAMSGTSIPVDRRTVMSLLGFAQLCENTVDSVSAADHVTEAAAALASLMVVVGRIAQDLYVWTTQEFDLIDLTDSFSSPSSLMPQKRNALVMEYIRSRTARMIGEMTGSFTVLHNVGYMDTEEIEIECYRPLVEGLDLVREAVPTLTEAVRVMKARRDHMLESAAAGYSSVTALAEYIQTTCGLSYRTAHRVVARTVLLATERAIKSDDIEAGLIDEAANEMLGHPLRLDPAQVGECLNPAFFVHGLQVIGSTAPSEVVRMIADRTAKVDDDADKVRSIRERIEKSESALAGKLAALRRSAPAIP